MQSFWDKLDKPIVGLAPMDGVTDAPFRFLAAKYGKPDITFTEFTSVEGICAGAIRPLEAFIYSETERPILAQLFGNTPECFYKACFLVAELGFDGIDINMGCPSKNVASKGSGASLIQTPKLAIDIIKQCKKAVKEWSEGKDITEVGLPEEIVQYAEQNRPNNLNRKLLPVSVKTRTGLHSIIIEEWIKNLLSAKPVAITVHGRTLKQMYNGSANWDAIAKAAKLCKKANTHILGNGDIQSYRDAVNKAKEYGTDGVLIGRAALGKPWVFNPNHQKPNHQQIFNLAIEHSLLHEETLKRKPFLHMRKHLAWYCRGFHGASQIRQELMKTESSGQVENLLKNLRLDAKV